MGFLSNINPKSRRTRVGRRDILLLKKIFLPGIIILKVALLVFFLWGEGEVKWSGSHAAGKVEELSEETRDLEMKYQELRRNYQGVVEENEILEKELARTRERQERWEEELEYLDTSLEGVPVLRHGNRENNKVALTIDDGYDPFWVVKALLILEEKEVAATLFPIGSVVEKYPAIWERAHTMGHELGNHTFSHRKIPRLTPLEVLGEVGKWQKAVNRALGGSHQEARFFRPPGMSGFESTRDSSSYEYLIGLAGLEAVVLWDIDHSYPLSSRASPREIADYVVANTRGGSIILLHFIENDVEALPLIIDELRARGFQLVTLGEMFPENL